MKPFRLKVHESDIQEAIVQLLDIYERQGKLRYYHVPNQLPRPRILKSLIGQDMVNRIYGMIEAALKALGKRPGVPDLCILLTKPRGMTVYWEIKTDEGRHTTEQLQWLDWLGANGFPCATVRDLDQAQKLLNIYFTGPVP